MIIDMCRILFIFQIKSFFLSYIFMNFILYNNKKIFVEEIVRPTRAILLVMIPVNSVQLYLKKVKMQKNQLLHARQPREEIFEFCSCSGLIFMTDFWNFGRLFLIGETFFQNFFWLKSLLMVGTLLGLMWSWIKKPWMTSTRYVSRSGFDSSDYQVWL